MVQVVAWVIIAFLEFLGVTLLEQSENQQITRIICSSQVAGGVAGQ